MKNHYKILSFRNMLSALFAMAFCLTLTAQNNSVKINGPSENKPWDDQSLTSEVTELRGRFAKHFQTENGTMKMYSSPSSIHYLSSTGQWEDIDVAIESNTNINFSAHPYANTENAFQTFYPASPVAGSLVTVTTEGEMNESLESVYLTDASGNTVHSYSLQTPAQTLVSGNKITYTNVINSVNLAYTQGNDGRKFDLVLNSAQLVQSFPASAQWIVIKEKITLPEGWTVQENELGVNIYSNSGTWMANIPQPSAFETPGENEEYVDESEFKTDGEISYALEGNELFILTSFNVDWLSDASRSYPLMLDPTVNLSPTAVTYGTGYQSSTTGKSNGIVRITGSTTPSTAWARFDMSTVPLAATAVAATYYGYYYTGTGTTGGNDKICDIVGMQNIDPIPEPGSSLYTYIMGTPPVYNNNYLFATVSSYDWYPGILGGTALTDITTQITSQGWTALGLRWNSGNSSFMYHYGWNGTTNICYLELEYTEELADNDAGVLEIPSPISYCANEQVALIAKVRNFGLLPLDSCMVVWNVNGSLDSAWFNVDLDTINGSGNIDTVLFIDSIVPGTGALNLTVYTKWPNGVADTLNNNDTASIFIASPALSGTYVIGTSTSADFASFTAAAAALNTSGVCGPVIMEVETGTYGEEFALDQILGSSSTNTITFQSQSGDSSDVVLSFATSTQNGIVQLNGTDWVRFHQLTFENTSTSYDIAIDFVGGADSNIVSNCRFIGNYNTTTSSNATLIRSSGANDNGTHIINNRFENSGYGVYIYGVGTTSLEGGLVLENNEFINQYYQGARLYYMDAPVVRNNFVTSNSTYTSGYGIYLYYCDNALEISGNHVVPTAGSTWPTYGIYLGQSDGAGLNNTGRIFNNRVILGDDTTNTSTTTFYGFYLTSANAQRFVNNTITIMSGSTSARALYQTSSDLLFFKNNLFSNHSGGYAAYYNSGISIEVDRNNYYSQGTEIYYGGQNMTLEAYQAATGYDSNSYNVHPQWSDIYNGFLCNDVLDGIASSISYVTTDYSGFPRSSTQPDPGAVEFIGVNNFTLGGNDTVCGSEFTLEVSGATSSIAWLVNGSGSSGNSVTLNNTGNTPQTYNVAVAFTSATGCGNANDNALITLVPDAQLDSNTHLCADESELLAPGGGSNATYLWSPTGEMTAGITVSNPGTYSVVKTELGCVSTASTMVTKSDAVQIDDLEVCDEDLPLVVDASINNGLNYAWSGGNSPTSAINAFDATGNYSVTATDIFGCSSSSDFFFEVIDVPQAVISHTHVANYYFFSSTNSVNVGSNATYAWDFGDGSTSTDANPQHAYPWSSQPVTYTITLAITNDCGSDITTESWTVDVVGVEDVSGDYIKAYPNPAGDVLNIHTDKLMNDVQINITDISGRIVWSKQLSSLTTTTLDLSGLASGSYVLSLIDSEGAYNKVIIVE